MDHASCVLCGEEAETARHLFLHCNYAAGIWYAVCRWLGVFAVLPADVMMSYGLLVGCGRNKKIRKGFAIVWMAFIRVIWKVRNERVFNNATVEVTDAVDMVQRLSWQWYLNKMASSSCLLYEWIWNPCECMLR
ncbi:hypothetical protein TSUD_272720 [Trifolium subterraneum]|uniref:Reverse transcriptase zinc-binding domain-containing protein n=1 Tax=Trifolium subterraneum TaxID=3900 RepID=A0A2Z6PUJ4_TRISU|nr:hypothetical protein TSUD_272720 [Trifolium subterraneum]